MKNINKTVPPVLFAALAVLAIYLGTEKPMHNWDMVMYAAAAKSFEEEEAGKVHSFTFGRLRRSVSPAEYKALAEPEGEDPDSVYRRSISKNPEALARQLPFFQIRLLYTGLIYMMYKSGINVFLASHLVSALSAAAGIIILYFISVSVLPVHFVYLVPAGAAAAGVLDLAKYSTPDGLTFLTIIVSVYLLVKKRYTVLLLILPLSIAVRTDLIVYVLPLCMLLLAGGTGGKGGILLSGIFSIMIFMVINRYYSNPGWTGTFHLEFLQVSAFPPESGYSVTARDYLKVLLSETGSLLRHGKFILYLPVSAASLYIIFRRMGREALSRPVPLAASASLIYAVLHYLLFPDAHERFFAASYLVGGITLLYVLDRLILSGYPYKPAGKDNSQRQ